MCLLAARHDLLIYGAVAINRAPRYSKHCHRCVDNNHTTHALSTRNALATHNNCAHTNSHRANKTLTAANIRERKNSIHDTQRCALCHVSESNTTYMLASRVSAPSVVCVCVCVEGSKRLSSQRQRSVRGQPGVNLSELRPEEQHPFAAMLDKTESSDLWLTSDLFKSHL